MLGPEDPDYGILASCQDQEKAYQQQGGSVEFGEEVDVERVGDVQLGTQPGYGVARNHCLRYGRVTIRYENDRDTVD